MRNTPFFPAWRSRLAALGRRVQKVRQQSLLHLELLFAELIPPWLLSQADEGANSRDRVYSVRRTFWGFLYQALNPACPCREVVRQIQALFCLDNRGAVDEGTSAYCQARRRLPLDSLQRIRHAVAARADNLLVEAQQLWHGLRPKVIDATTVTLPDTPKNQRAYPQSRIQKPGCGFPLMRILGIFSLSSGVLLDYQKGNKHQSELALLYKLLDHFKPGDLAIADRGFCNFVLMAALLLRGVDAVFRLHQSRRVDWRKGQRLGKHDRLFTWSRPRRKPRYLPNFLWKRIPCEVPVRVLRFQLNVRGFRSESVTLATTLLDAEVYPAAELAQLYARRWKIELWFRDIKTSMGMEVLRCLSPKMAHKELEMYLIAYNLTRALMTEASAIYETPLDCISFKGTVDATRQFSIAIAQARSKKKQRQLVNELLAVLARDELPARPGRREPRAVKRRPKPFPLLTDHRHRFKEIRHRNRYWKSNPRNART
jgi:hypothetical protein